MVCSDVAYLRTPTVTAEFAVGAVAEIEDARASRSLYVVIKMQDLFPLGKTHQCPRAVADISNRIPLSECWMGDRPPWVQKVHADVKLPLACSHRTPLRCVSPTLESRPGADSFRSPTGK